MKPTALFLAVILAFPIGGWWSPWRGHCHVIETTTGVALGSVVTTTITRCRGHLVTSTVITPLDY